MRPFAGLFRWSLGRLAVLMCIVSGIIGTFGLATELGGYHQLAGLGSKGIPIAPSSALCIILLSVAMAIQSAKVAGVTAKVLSAAFAAIVLFIGTAVTYSVIFEPSWDLELILFPHQETVSGVLVKHMSPMASVSYILLASAVLALVPRARWAGWKVRQSAAALAISAFAIGFVGTLGHAFNSPLLYGSQIRPIALIASISLILLGAVLMANVGPEYWPLRAFSGNSVRARLLRYFLPVVVLIVLVTNWLMTVLPENLSNPAILSSLLALGSATAALAAVMRLSNVIGGQVDRKNKDLEEAQSALERANTQLEQRSEELSRLNRELEAFSYSVSHDLRAPLRSIDGFAYTLGEKLPGGADGEQMREELDRIRAAAQRMGTLIDDLLSLSRATRGGLEIGSVDLAATANSIIARLRAQDPTRKVSFVCADEAWAEGDARLLEVALENLLNNAWKFTSKRADARIEFEMRMEDGRKVYTVRDNGAGFDQAFAGRLFEPFERLHPGKEFPGTGIGLAIVKRIVDRHRGQIWAEGAAGKGASFSFTLGDVLRSSPSGSHSETMSST